MKVTVEPGPVKFSPPYEKWEPPPLANLFHGYPHLDYNLQTIDDTYDPININYVKSIEVLAVLHAIILCLIFGACIMFFLLYIAKDRPSYLFSDPSMVMWLIGVSAGLVFIVALLELACYFSMTTKMSVTRTIAKPAPKADERNYPTYQSLFKPKVDELWKDYLTNFDQLKRDFARSKCSIQMNQLDEAIKNLSKHELSKYAVTAWSVDNSFKELRSRNRKNVLMFMIFWVMSIVGILLLYLRVLLKKIKILMLSVTIIILWLFAMICYKTSEAFLFGDICQAPDDMLKYMHIPKEAQIDQVVDGHEPGCINYVNEMNNRTVELLMVYLWNVEHCIIDALQWEMDAEERDKRFAEQKSHLHVQPEAVCPYPTMINRVMVYDAIGGARSICTGDAKIAFVGLQLLFLYVTTGLLILILLNFIRSEFSGWRKDGGDSTETLQKHLRHRQRKQEARAMKKVKEKLSDSYLKRDTSVHRMERDNFPDLRKLDSRKRRKHYESESSSTSDDDEQYIPKKKYRSTRKGGRYDDPDISSSDDYRERRDNWEQEGTYPRTGGRRNKTRYSAIEPKFSSEFTTSFGLTPKQSMLKEPRDYPPWSGKERGYRGLKPEYLVPFEEIIETPPPPRNPLGVERSIRFSDYPTTETFTPGPSRYYLPMTSSDYNPRSVHYYDTPSFYREESSAVYPSTDADYASSLYRGPSTVLDYSSLPAHDDNLAPNYDTRCRSYRRYRNDRDMYIMEYRPISRTGESMQHTSLPQTSTTDYSRPRPLVHSTQRGPVEQLASPINQTVLLYSGRSSKPSTARPKLLSRPGTSNLSYLEYRFNWRQFKTRKSGPFLFRSTSAADTTAMHVSTLPERGSRLNCESIVLFQTADREAQLVPLHESNPVQSGTVETEFLSTMPMSTMTNDNQNGNEDMPVGSSKETDMPIVSSKETDMPEVSANETNIDLAVSPNVAEKTQGNVEELPSKYELVERRSFTPRLSLRHCPPSSDLTKPFKPQSAPAISNGRDQTLGTVVMKSVRTVYLKEPPVLRSKEHALDDISEDGFNTDLVPELKPLESKDHDKK